MPQKIIDNGSEKLLDSFSVQIFVKIFVFDFMFFIQIIMYLAFSYLFKLNIC